MDLFSPVLLSERQKALFFPYVLYPVVVVDMAVVDVRTLVAAVCTALFVGLACNGRRFNAAEPRPCSLVILRPAVTGMPQVEQILPQDAAALPKQPQHPGPGSSAAEEQQQQLQQLQEQQQQQQQQPQLQPPQEQPRGADYYERERQRLGLLAPTLPDAQCAPPQPRERPAADQYFAVCTVVKDQNTDILEWALYHHMIGASKIYVFDNNSTMPMIRELHPLAEAGVVEYVYFRRDPALRPSPIACSRRGAPLHLPLAHETTTSSSGCPDQWEAGRAVACASCL